MLCKEAFITSKVRPHVNPHVYDDIKTIRDHTHLSAHGGARFYLADAFPSKYRNRLFMCNIHEHAVLTDIMERRVDPALWEFTAMTLCRPTTWLGLDSASKSVRKEGYLRSRLARSGHLWQRSPIP